MFIPAVGSEVFVKALPPFNNVPLNDGYILTSSTLITDYVGSNIDIFKEVYELVGLTVSDLQKDIADGVRILTLGDKSGTNKGISIPSNRLEFLSNDQLKYVKFGIGINMGLFPKDTDFSAIEQEIAELVGDRLGIAPTTKIVKLSSFIGVSIDEHRQFTASREFRIKSKLSCRLQNVQLKNIIEDCNAAIAKLKLCMRP